MYTGILMISWLAAGFIGCLPKLLDEEFVKETIPELFEEVGLSVPKNTRLFWLAAGTLFGYYTLYKELKRQLSK